MAAAAANERRRLRQEIEEMLPTLTPEDRENIQKATQAHPDMSQELLDSVQAFTDAHNEDDLEAFYDSEVGQKFERILFEIILGDKLAKARGRNLLSLGLVARAFSAALPKRGRLPEEPAGLGVEIHGRHIPGQIMDDIASFLSGKNGSRDAQMRKLENRARLPPGAAGAGAHHGGTRRKRKFTNNTPPQRTLHRQESHRRRGSPKRHSRIRK
jgi:hypothetical protein